MKHFLLWFFMYLSLLSLAHADCAKVPTRDFSQESKTEISSKTYSYLGSLGNQCWYFRDVVFKNGHGQQAVVVASSRGKCLGFFRTSLAAGAELRGTELVVKTAGGDIYKADLSNSIPKSLYFDGEESKFELCIK